MASRASLFKVLALSVLSLTSAVAMGQACPKVRQGVRISATGDILIHKALYEYVVNSRSSSRFQALWSKITPVLRDGDLTIGNLEGPVARNMLSSGKNTSDVGFVYDDRVYSGTNFVFNFHPSLIEDLKSSGFNFLTTANNHTMDRRWQGADSTIEELRRAGVQFAGTRMSQSNESISSIVNVKGITLGMIACTEHLNGMPDPHKQVLLCNGSRISEMIKELKKRTDAVIVFPHWGPEYVTQPTSSQRGLAKQWISAGALAIIGNHPHVLQTSEWMTNGDGKKALVVYSLGNFIAAQAAMERRVTAVAHIDLVMGRSGAEIAQYSYTPVIRPSGSASLALLDPNTKDGKYARSQLGAPVCL